LERQFPELRNALPRISLANLPTPVARFRFEAGAGDVWIKDDGPSSTLYGGNKVRKLEYLLAAVDRSRFQRIATYGAVSSNHALATALHARQLGLRPVALLLHQTRTRLAGKALRAHRQNGTTLVPFGGDRAARVRTQRQVFADRTTAVIPMGGTSWRGCIGFIDAGLELAAQIESGELPCPQRIYMAAGTLGSAVGLALGLALKALPVDVHAVRVTPQSLASRAKLVRLMQKTCTLLHRLDDAIPADLHKRARITLREGFIGPGYACSTPQTDAAIAIASNEAGLTLEATYTGKTMAALLADRQQQSVTRSLFWNTYFSGSTPAYVSDSQQERVAGAAPQLPEEFLRYCD